MTEHDYIVISALQRLRAAMSILRDVSPIDGIHSDRTKEKYREALRVISAMTKALEREIDRLRDQEEGVGDE